MMGSRSVTFMPRAVIFPLHGLTAGARFGIWDPMSTESSCLFACRTRGTGTGMPGFGMMTIITITTRFRGASG